MLPWIGSLSLLQLFSGMQVIASWGEYLPPGDERSRPFRQDERPRSMVGGDLHWIWKPYEIYQEVDYVRTLDFFLWCGDRLTEAYICLGLWNPCFGKRWRFHQRAMYEQLEIWFRPCNRLRSFPAFLNIVETFMNLGYLYLAHIAATPVAPLLGFASAVMTLSKTVLYWAQEYYCGGGLKNAWWLRLLIWKC